MNNFSVKRKVVKEILGSFDFIDQSHFLADICASLDFFIDQSRI